MTMRSFTSCYAFRGLIAHLHATEEWARLFVLLETKPFLADQAEALDGFQASGVDLETYVLPAAIAAGEWPRFLHYAALALNLRGLAENLAEPEILRALAQAGRTDLVLDAAGRLPDRFRQAQAFASIAAGSANPTRSGVLRQLEDRLDDLAREANAKSHHGESLASIAWEVAPDLPGRWMGWIDGLAPDQATLVWRAVAEAWLRRRCDPRAPELWQALTSLGDPSQILSFAPAALGAVNPEDPAEILRRLEALLPDLLDRLYAGATFLGELARQHPERACAAWEDWSARAPLIWSAELIDRGRMVIGRLEPRRIEEIISALEDATARAALRVVVLEARGTLETASAALVELLAVPDGPGKLHWSLRYLTARPPEPQDGVRRQVLAAGRYLQVTRFAADARDLARWLDLIAVHLPHQISRHLDDVLWSPTFTREKALVLADAAMQDVILNLLLERAERCAAALSSTEAEGFVLRKELMIRATCHLCELTRSLDGLARVAARLLPEEEDELRSRLAPRLAALSGEGLRLAEEVCAGIGDRRRRLVTLLRSAPDVPGEILAPANLYAAIARVEILKDECRGLEALLATPADPHELLQRLVLPIGDPSLRTRALLRLARHILAFEITCHHRPDRLVPLELVRWLITTETDEELAALTPEIAELGAAAGGSRSTAEVQEAVRQLAALESVDWPLRRDALEALLARLASSLLPARKAAMALTTILRLPQQLRPETARQQLSQRWSEILPLVVATADRLPEKDLQQVRRVLQKSLRDLAPDAAQQRIFALCLAAPADRTKAADRAGVIDSSELEALAYLLIKAAPHLVSEVVQRLPVPERVRLTLRLLRHGWLPKETARALLQGVSGSGSEDEAEVWCGPRQGDEAEWIARAASWMAKAASSPSDPRIEPLLARLWSAPEVWRPALAWAVQDSLRRGGYPQGEAILRLWLHAHLAPQLGQGRPQSLAAAADAEETLQLALALGPERSSS